MTARARRLVVAHQANYLPYLGFFEKISVSDLFILVDDTQFVKRGPFGWIHRNRVLSHEGPLWLTVPVRTHDRYEQSIAEVEIDNSRNWRRKHFRTLQRNYGRSRYFSDFSQDIQDIYEQEWKRLFDLNRHFIEFVFKALDIKVPMMISSELKLEGKGSDYVLDLSKKTQATHYLSGLHGRDYLDIESFKREDIALVFQNFEGLEYSQGGDGESFEKNLSVLDALFHVGPDKTRQLMEQGADYALPSRG